jgi:hypothetical protein
MSTKIAQFLFACMVLAMVSVSGCTVAKISGAGPRPLMMNTPQARFGVVEHFIVQESQSFDWTHTAELDRLVAQILARTQADAVINLRVAVKITAGNFCLNGVTCGFAQAQTFVIEGDAIRFM